MTQKVPDDIANELYKALNRLEISTDIIKSYVNYCDVNEKELTESERIHLHRCKEFLGISK